jgi:hypothetical protein
MLPDSKPDGLAGRLFAQPGTPDVRVQRCLEAIQRALEEHDCQLIVSVHFANGGASPEITVAPSAPSMSQDPHLPHQ